MRYEEREPDEALKPYVKCIWRLNRTYGASDDGEVLWPDGCQEILFHYGTAYAAAGTAMPRAFFIGMLSRSFKLDADGPVRLFGVRLLPWGLNAFADTPLKTFNDQAVPLSEIWDESEVERLEASLETADMDEAAELLQQYLKSILAAERADPRIIGALSKLYREPMHTDVPQAVAESGYSSRQFERKCMELIGMPAKRLHKISRFNQARLRIFHQPDIDLHQCMLDFGYYDYAHFSKDFKLCLGITPAEYKSWMQRKFAAFNEARDVVFLQDEP